MPKYSPRSSRKSTKSGPERSFVRFVPFVVLRHVSLIYQPPLTLIVWPVM